MPDDFLITPPGVPSNKEELNRMAYSLFPDYMKPKTGPINFPTQPGKMEDVAGMNPLPWLGADVAGNLTGLGGPAKAIFGGVLAKTADLAALREAKGMTKAGIDSIYRKGVHPLFGHELEEPSQKLTAADSLKRKVWEDTGWFPGNDTKWRSEIPDTGMIFKPRGTLEDGSVSKTGYFNNVLEHPKLVKAYPDLQDYKLTIQKTDRSEGNQVQGKISAGGPTNQDRLGTMAHELQHAVQDIEGFAPGTSPSWMFANLAPGGMKGMPHDEVEAALKRAHLLYNDHAGEVEARNVENRFSNNLYRSTPWNTEDVGPGAQIYPSHWLKQQPPELQKVFNYDPNKKINLMVRSLTGGY